jgi:hypothetical protein
MGFLALGRVRTGLLVCRPPRVGCKELWADVVATGHFLFLKQFPNLVSKLNL